MDQSLQPPGYPAVQGQQQPDLNLAGVSTPMTDLGGGHFSDSIPPQALSVPPLSAGWQDIGALGIDDARPYFDLDLASACGFPPAPADLAKPMAFDPGAIVSPTFDSPDFSVPSLRGIDLTGPGLDQVPAFQPDPHLADLLAFDHPRGLDIHASSDFTSADPLMKPDPDVPDLEDYDHPGGLQLHPPLLVDPDLPDLQHPQLTQDIMMPDRPGDLDDDALDAMHNLADDDAAEQTDYPQSQMDASGMNSRRRRHFEPMLKGLDAVERGKAL